MYNRLSSDKEESWQLASMFLEPCKLFLSSENNMLIRKYGWQGEAVFLEIEIQPKGGGELPVGIFLYQLCSVQSLSRVRLCNPMDWGHQAPLSITNSLSLLKLMFIEWVMPSKHLILCHPLLLTSLEKIKLISQKEDIPFYSWSKIMSTNLVNTNP